MKAILAVAALIAITFAPPAHADASDFITYLYDHNLGCGQGSLKCSGDPDLIKIGQAVCSDIDTSAP
jgi:hypothetical protein